MCRLSFYVCPPVVTLLRILSARAHGSEVINSTSAKIACRLSTSVFRRSGTERALHQSEGIMMYGTQSKGTQHCERVLCVDNNSFTLFVNATILRNQGYEVFVCSNPLRAALIAMSEEFDLAILDYEMPKLNGAELAAFCKAANPDIKVILFSGSLSIPNRELVFVDDFVEKSEGVDALLAAIQALLFGDKIRSLPATTFNNYSHMNQ
jgi:CheY-like chemotaxis protein